MSLFIIWAFMIGSSTIAYFKMEEKEKQEAREFLKSKDFIFIFGFLLIGYPIAFIGSKTEVPVITMIGTVMFITGGITGAITTWWESRKRSIYIIILLIIALVPLFL